jgi:hypothetical protein
MLSNGEMMVTKLQRIAEKARTDSGCRFTSLFHLMNVEMLRECFRQLRKDAAVGIEATNLSRDTFRHFGSMAIPQSSKV